MPDAFSFGLFDALSLAPLLRLLQPIYDFLHKRFCVDFFWYSVCFTIMDIFDNWLVKFVNRAP